MGDDFDRIWRVDVEDKFGERNISTEKAAEFLQLAIEPLRNGEPIPDPLASFLADAIEEAMKEKNNKNRIHTLVSKLCLKANHRHRKGDWVAIGMDFDQCLDEEIAKRKSRGETEWGAPALVAKNMAKKYKIEPTLARKYWDEWVDAKLIGELE